MATNNLKVDEIRAQLAQRGLSTAGIKHVLVRRLEDALRDESEKSADSEGDIRSSRKRQRDSDAKDADPEAPRKIKAIDELRSMNVKQLREEASIRGVSAAGTKAQLLERLCADDDSVSSDNDEAEKGSKRENADSHSTLKIKAIDELQKMNIKQLREEAAKRGISAAGTKKELLERLFCDNDNVSNDKDQAEEESKKEDADFHATVRIKIIDELQKMNIKQLQEEAAKRGISAAGTKKELLERLCSDNDNVSNDKDQVSSAEEENEEKIVTATKKGSAVLDKWLPDHIKAQYHVLQVGNEIYDAMLNQTNLGENNNKFFVIQVLESDDGGKFMVYNRWGRVGVKGQDYLNGPYTSQQAAISEFEKKFYAKTKNHWSNRNEFVFRPKSYTWLEMDYSETKNDPAVQEKRQSTVRLEPQESKLEARIAKFISLICNMSMMRQQMMEIGYNAEKLPLGKLSKSTILKGYDVLKRIADVIGQADKNTLKQLSGEFYSVIPHDFGFRNTSLFIIDTPQKLKSKLEMVEALGEIEVAMKLIEDDTDMEDPLYSHYRRLHCDLLPLEAHSKEFSMVIFLLTQDFHAFWAFFVFYFGCSFCSLVSVDCSWILVLLFFYLFIYVVNMCQWANHLLVVLKLILLCISCHYNFFPTKPPTYLCLRLRNTPRTLMQKRILVMMLTSFRYLRSQERVKLNGLRSFQGQKNRMLLWHGSRLTNWTGILSQGLRIAPPEAPVTGYMFGKGVYFADMFSKSANYCCSTQAATAGVLLLCEVALGDMAELQTANYHADKLPAGKLSTKGVGATAPDLSEALTLEDGVVVPLGTPKEQPGPKGSLLYNEYIVYNVEQIRMRYLVQVKFNYKR